MSSPTTQALRAADAYSSTGLACAVGDGGTVLTNSSGTWVKRSPGTSVAINACAVLSQTTVLVAGASGYLYRSTDGGATWSRFADFGWTEDWLGIDMKPGGCGWTVGGVHEF